ncbi:MAG TPA: hypothetical protein VL500_04265 [Candidatus Eisenbacteria bacterium]|jgi:hypothetical protein|nr:hypothetical protein [Candidatus Eisenbacteria bacterium]
MLTLLFALLYVQTGFQLGKKAEKTWKKGDSESLASFLLFPVSHARGKVGDASMPMMGGINGGETFYRTLMTLGWPVFLAWNALVISVLGPDKVVRRLTGEHKADRYKALEASILKEEQRVDKVIRKLEAGRKPRRPRASKAKALPAPAQPPADMTEAQGNWARPEPPAEAGFQEKRGEHADPAPPPVQVRVTVDVTASGPATEETGRAEEEPRVNTAPDKEHVVH